MNRTLPSFDWRPIADNDEAQGCQWNDRFLWAWPDGEWGVVGNGSVLSGLQRRGSNLEEAKQLAQGAALSTHVHCI